MILVYPPRASLAALGLAWVAPFLQPFHRFPLTAFYSEWLAFALGLVAALLLLWKTAWRDATVPLVALAPVGLIALLGLHVFLGRVPYPEQALTAVLYLLWAMLLMQLAHVLRRELGLAPVAETLAWFTLAGGLCAALAGLVQHYEITTALSAVVAAKRSPTVYGNLAQQNHYAAYLTLALAGIGYLYGRARLHAVSAAASAGLLLLMLALSGSRSPWLYLAALAALAALLLRRDRSSARGRRLAAFALWLLPGFVAAQWLATLPLLQPPGGAMSSLERLYESATGVAARLQVGQEAWRMFLEAPLLGAGFGQFSWHHYAWTPPESAAPGLFNHSHNLLLQLLAETGLAGACIVAAAVLYWLSGLRRVALDLEWWWLLGGLSVIAIHSCLEYPLWYAYFLGVASVLVGLGATRAFELRRAALARVAVAAALALGWVNLAAILSAYREFEGLIFETRAPQVKEQAFVDTIVRVHREPLLTPYVELALTFAITVSGENLREKLELNTRVTRFVPIAPVVYKQAMLLALAGEPAAASSELDRAARAYPDAFDEAVAELRLLADRHPGAFRPLLELAAARSAEVRRNAGAR